MSEKELNYWFKIFVKNPYCFLSGEGKRLSFAKVFKLLKELYRENKQLKTNYCNRSDCSGRINNSKKYDSIQQKYDKQVNNWNELKEYLEKTIVDSKSCGAQQYYYEQIYKFVIEIEQGNDSNE